MIFVLYFCGDVQWIFFFVTPFQSRGTEKEVASFFQYYFRVLHALSAAHYYKEKGDSTAAYAATDAKIHQTHLFSALISSLVKDLQQPETKDLYALSLLSNLEKQKREQLFSSLEENLRAINKDYVFWAESFKPLLFENFETFQTERGEHFFKAVSKGPKEERKTAVRYIASVQAFVGEDVSSGEYARVLLLGHGDAGKTMLRKYLMNKELPTGHDESTPRIEIGEWKTPSRKETVVAEETGEEKVVEVGETDTDIWDFGGQVIMHSTHKFFLIHRCVYVIVCNSRKDEQPDQWLEMIKNNVLGKEKGKKKAIIVYNQIEKDKKEKKQTEEKQTEKPNTVERKNTITRNFGQDFDFEWHTLPFSSLKEGETTDLEDALDTLIRTIAEQADVFGQEGVSQVYLDIRTALKKNVLEREELEEVIKTQQEIARKRREKKGKGGKQGTEITLSNEDIISGLCEYGFVFSSGKENKDSKLFVAQRHWLTFGVYAMINGAKTKEKNGLICFEDLKGELFEKWKIEKNGMFSEKKKNTRKKDIVEYTEENIKTLLEIAVNYRWAIKSNKRHGEYIFQNALRIDEPEQKDIEQYQKRHSTEEKEEEEKSEEERKKSEEKKSSHTMSS